MSRGMNQKFKFPYLMKIMKEKTDDEHGFTLSQIMDELEKYVVLAFSNVKMKKLPAIFDEVDKIFYVNEGVYNKYFKKK